MLPYTVSPRIAQVGRSIDGLLRFANESLYSRRQGDPEICDFTFGNPHEMPLTGFVDALRRAVEPRDKNWFAYKQSEPAACEVVAASLRERYSLPFEAGDVLMTNGAFAALAVALAALVEPGEQVIYNSPGWFFYEPIILNNGALAVRVQVDPITFDLDLDAIAGAINEHTRAVIVNSPNNPTGKIYPEATIARLSELLLQAGERYGRPIWLLSDDAYSRIVFDGREFRSPATMYPFALLMYTYGKALLTPGQRIGYIALPPALPQRDAVRNALITAQTVVGWAFPNADLQHSLPQFEHLTIDLAQLQRKRDRLVSALRDIGYQLHVPEGTFYLIVRAPLDDDQQFMDLLAEHDIFCLPGALIEMPGYFRISLTANDAMIDRALPGFAAAFEASKR
jgi:aspartate aminotransferase